MKKKNIPNNSDSGNSSVNNSGSGMSDFFAKIDLGIKSSKSRLEKVENSSILDQFDSEDKNNGYIKL